ncbi:MAG: mandelate racemase [Planctomycetota bacterium]|nr:MAG: mandelate racemase [Planctomycetota bacterium]
MRLRPERVQLFLTDCRARLPFRFGAAVLTAAPLCTARLECSSPSGARVEGAAADLLVPRWFRKDPARSVREDVEELLASAQEAAAELLAPAAPAASAFAHWLRLERARVTALDFAAPQRLVRGFGVALLERALLDAACRAAGCSFFEGLRRDLFGFQPQAALAELATWSLADCLPAAPAERVLLRHTVGLADPLHAAEIAPGERLHDGLPQALDQDIRRYGLRCFKLKLSGDPGRDLERLVRSARVIEEECGAPQAVTLDGNEQFASLEDLARLLEGVARTPEGGRLLRALHYIEQPLPRQWTFDAARHRALGAVEAFAPLLIDEADAGVEAFPRAAELGYRGVSIKNCKGVFRALLNFGLCARSNGRLFQSGEDLTNLPIVALQQDLATMAALGVAHVERNGHHYFRGLEHLPPAEAREALARHPDLYEPQAHGAGLRIRDGILELRSLQCPGYGYAVAPRWEARIPAQDWRFPEA